MRLAFHRNMYRTRSCAISAISASCRNIVISDVRKGWMGCVWGGGALVKRQRTESDGLAHTYTDNNTERALNGERKKTESSSIVYDHVYRARTRRRWRQSDWRMKAPGGPPETIALMSLPPRSRAGHRPRCVITTPMTSGGPDFRP
jgi:hypothetical protein